jgi:hypothetical protein
MDDSHFGGFQYARSGKKNNKNFIYHPYQHVEKVATFPKQYVGKSGYKDMKRKSSIILLHFQLLKKIVEILAICSFCGRSFFGDGNLSKHISFSFIFFFSTFGRYFANLKIRLLIIVTMGYYLLLSHSYVDGQRTTLRFSPKKGND